ncbi:MAG TPA: HIT family protein [Flavitalea sp.]|nr:HIT family protein [Flavitalea sp.]
MQARKNKAEILFMQTARSIVAFMSHGPRNPGHVLVIPLMHMKLLTELPDSISRNVITAARKIALAIKKTDIRAEGFNFQINSGEASGQEVFHVHMHVPRYLGEPESSKKILEVNKLELVAVKIRDALKE